ncbi:MAG: hypothetical protein RLZZ393_538 [Pseudomonadota bacterium]
MTKAKTRSTKRQYSPRLGLLLPTPEEEEAINRGIAEDPDAYVPTDEEFAQMKPFRGRPWGSGSRVKITLRLDEDTIKRFRATGAGWQTRLNDLLVSAAKKAGI